MPVTRLMAIALAAAALPTGATASAQDAVHDPEAIAAILRDSGHPAALTAGPDRMISTASDRHVWSLWFDGCTARNACASAQFYAGLPSAVATEAAIDAFNRAHPAMQAFRDSDGALALQMDWNPDGAHADDVIRAWEAALDALARATQ